MYNVTSVKEADSVIEALQAIADAIPPANPVPDVTSADDGKVLKATYSGGEGSYDWDTPDSGLPSTSGHNLNEVLIIEDTTTNPPTADWNSLNEVLPNMDPYYYPSNGEVITYNSSTHKAEWQTPQSGGGLPSISDSDNGKVLQATYDDKSGTGSAEWSRLTTGITEYYIGDITSSNTWTAVTSGSDTVAYKCLVSSGGTTALLAGGVLAIKLYDGSYSYVDYFYINDKSGGVEIYLTKDKYSLLSVSGVLSSNTLVYLK